MKGMEELEVCDAVVGGSTDWLMPDIDEEVVAQIDQATKNSSQDR